MAAPKKKRKKLSSTKKRKVVKKKRAAKRTSKKVVSRKRGSKKKLKVLSLRRVKHNPVMSPTEGSYWESEGVFNPAAVMHGGRVHLFYRALGPDGVSRVGYASSKDGINFDNRYPHPVYMPENVTEDQRKHHLYTSPARLAYDRALYASGGGWGGCEDPRAVQIDDRIYLTLNTFNGWHSMRVGFTSIDEEDFKNKKWNWDKFAYLSRPGDRQKNWVLFPEKIHGKFAIFHNLDKGDPSRVHIAYLDKLDMHKTPNQDEAPDPQLLPDHMVSWHNRTRSASAPPVKTKYGWLLFYHAMSPGEHHRYKLGAMLLDPKDPQRILYRSNYPILEPDMWYENDWKPGIIYASGAVVKGDTLYIYYGGGDKHIGVAYTKLDEFVRKLRNNEHAVFSIKSSKVEN